MRPDGSGVELNHVRLELQTSSLQAVRCGRRLRRWPALLDGILHDHMHGEFEHEWRWYGVPPDSRHRNTVLFHESVRTAV